MTPPRLDLQIRALLARYLPELVARVVWERALRVLGYTEARAAEDPARVIDALKGSLQVFVAPDKQPALRQELQALLERVRPGTSLTAPPLSAVPPPLSAAPAAVRAPVRSWDDVLAARTSARTFVQSVGGNGLVAQKVSTVISNLGQNLVRHAGGGTVEVMLRTDSPRRLEVVVSDRGPGIPHVESLLAEVPGTGIGLHLGLRGVRALSDRFHIDTGPAGTRVEVAVLL